MAKRKGPKKEGKTEAYRLDTESAVDALVRYVKIDTTNPPGNEGPAAEFLASILEAHSLEYEILEATPGRPNLVARLRSGKDPSNAIALMHHMDVVPADESQWLHDPFGGELVGGDLWGRGTLDMKSLGIMQLWAFLGVADKVASGSADLQRDLVLIAVCDEEEGGASGARWLTVEHWDKVECTEMLTEGGFGVGSVIAGKDGFSCALTEKSAVWVELEARSTSGHGGIPPDEQALENLLACIAKLKARNRRYRMIGEMRRVYITLSEYASGPEKAVLKAIAQPGGRALLPILASRLSRPQRALLRDLVTVTMIQAGYKPNVVPGTARATLDCRLLPDVPTGAFIQEVQRIAEQYGVITKVIFESSPNGTSPAGELYDALEKASKASAPEAVFFPSVSTGFTDSRFWRKKGTKCVGLTPSIVSTELIETIHGENERIPLSEFERGLEITRLVVEDLVLSSST